MPGGDFGRFPRPLAAPRQPMGSTGYGAHISQMWGPGSRLGRRRPRRPHPRPGAEIGAHPRQDGRPRRRHRDAETVAGRPPARVQRGPCVARHGRRHEAEHLGALVTARRAHARLLHHLVANLNPTPARVRRLDVERQPVGSKRDMRLLRATVLRLAPFRDDQREAPSCRARRRSLTSRRAAPPGGKLAQRRRNAHGYSVAEARSAHGATSVSHVRIATCVHSTVGTLSTTAANSRSSRHPSAVVPLPVASTPRARNVASLNSLLWHVANLEPRARRRRGPAVASRPPLQRAGSPQRPAGRPERHVVAGAAVRQDRVHCPAGARPAAPGGLVTVPPPGPVPPLPRPAGAPVVGGEKRRAGGGAWPGLAARARAGRGHASMVCRRHAPRAAAPAAARWPRSRRCAS